MTSTPQSDSRQQASPFSKAWEAFARTQKTARPPAAAAAGETGDAGRETRPADDAVRQAPATDATEQTPDAGRELSAAVDAAPDAGHGLFAAEAAPDAGSTPLKPGFAEGCFNGLSYAAFLVLPLLLLTQFAAGYHALTPWLFPQEAGFARIYELMAASGHWLMAPAALPPVWFWMLRLLDALPYVDGPVVYAAGAALSGALTLLATWFLALSAGYGRRTAFASGLVLLSCLTFPALAHRVGPELFFTGLLTLGLACLLRGWNADRSFLWLPLGYAFVALAGLSGGLFGIILPMLGSLTFLLWKGALAARWNKMDDVIGFTVLLALPLAWLGAAMLFGPDDAQLRTLFAQLIAPFLPPYWPPKDPAWFYAAVLPPALAPWILVPCFVSWGSALARPFKRLASTRKENSGSAWIWIHLAVGLLLLSAMSSKFCLNMLPLMPLLAIVLGKAIVNLPQANSRAFFLVLAGLFGLAALALGFAWLAKLWPPIQSVAPLPYPKAFAAIQGLPVLAGICLLTALALWKLVDRRFPGACLLACAVAVTVLCLPALKLTSPSMQDVFLDRQAAPTSAPEVPAPGTPPAQVPTPPAETPEALPETEPETKAQDAPPETKTPDAIPETKTQDILPESRTETNTPDARPETRTQNVLPEAKTPDVRQETAAPAAPQPGETPAGNP